MFDLESKYRSKGEVLNFCISTYIKEPPGSLTEFENSIDIDQYENRTKNSFGIERVLSKINKFEIEKRLKSLKESKPDQIHPLIPKECAKVFAKPLKKLFRKSIKQGKIPNS